MRVSNFAVEVEVRLRSKPHVATWASNALSGAGTPARLDVRRRVRAVLCALGGLNVKSLSICSHAAGPRPFYMTAKAGNTPLPLGFARKRGREPLPYRIGSYNLQSSVRRLTAILLVTLFAGVPALAAFATSPAAADLPPCCRKDGVHMCSVRRSRPAPRDSKPVASALCRYSLRAHPAVIGQRTLVPLPTASSPAPPLHRRAVGQTCVFAPHRADYAANRKRGPPSAAF